MFKFCDGLRPTIGHRDLDSDRILILVEDVTFGKGLHRCEDDRVKGHSYTIASLRTIAPPKKADRLSHKGQSTFPKKPIAPPQAIALTTENRWC